MTLVAKMKRPSRLIQSYAELTANQTQLDRSSASSNPRTLESLQSAKLIESMRRWITAYWTF